MAKAATKKCPECGDEILGRADKKFCSDQCRNTFNNRQKQDANNFIRNVNNILRKNRRILAGLNPNGKAKASRNKLVEKGFNFDYFTNSYTTKTGKTYYYCYEFGYLPIEDDYYFLVMKQDYVDN
jgi:predicted nucleic acid-binding Zn ribbon protein